MEVEEPMDVDATEEFDKFDDLLEEGECDEEPNRVSRKVVSSVVSVPPIKHENAAGTFVTGVDIFSREAKEKIEERAKRFGLTQEAEKLAFAEAENLYESFGIDVDSESGQDYRLNVVHMRGTENLITKDIFKYFEEYAPASIEWINDISCNVVWLDQPSAARAILGKSRKIVGIKKEPKERLNSDDESDDSKDYVIINGKNHKEENAIHIKDVRAPLPPGIWRKGVDYKDSRNIFLRFATRSDKKQPHAEKQSQLHTKHGNAKYGGLKGILSTSSRKRGHKEVRETSPVLKTEPDTNGIAAKNPWGSLSKNWGRADFVEDDYLPKVPADPVSTVKQRLGFKPFGKEDIQEKDGNVIELSDSESESSSEEENWCKRSKMPRMRMHADDEEANLQKRKGKIRNLVNSTGGSVLSSDLRGKLVARRRLPPINKPMPMPREPLYQEQIQVIVTNPKAMRSSNFRDVNLTEDEDEDDDFEEQVEDDDEEEEGEIVDDSESDSKVEYEDEDDEEDEKQVNSESESDDTSSSISEKEVQGPKGSVIKVVQHKPKLQSTVSTVWSRLNHSKNDRRDDSSPERHNSKRDLRHTLRKTDLRSRIGNHHMRGRSPLRIELRNDKYSGRRSDSE